MNNPSFANPLRLAVTILMLFVLAFGANGKEYKPQHIRLPEDVSNNVNTIVKDKYGFLWFGTASGLTRYDGYSFLSYHNQSSNPYSLLSNYINDIVSDPRGYLWINTDAGYTRFDIAEEKFYNDLEKEFNPFGINSQIKDLLVTNDDYIWLLCEDGIYALNYESNEATKIQLRNKELNPAEITDIVADAKYVIAVTQEYEIWLINRNTKSLYKIIKIPKQTFFKDPTYDLVAYVDHDELLWIWSINDLYLYDVSNEQFIDAGGIRQMIPGALERFCQDESGHIWVAHNHQGITLLDKNQAIAGTTLSKDEVQKIENQTIGCLYADNNGTMWIGGNKFGLYRCDEISTRFDLLPVNDVNTVAPGDLNTAWIGTDANGIYFWDLSTNAVNHVSYLGKEWTGKAITCLLRDHSDGVYAGTYEGGLIHTDRYGQGRRYTMDDGLLINNIWALCYDAEGILWAGTLGHGMQYLDQDSGRWISVGSNDVNDLSNSIMSIALGRDDMLYIGTARGVKIFNPKNGERTALKIESLDNVHISQVMFDHNGMLWIASRKGLYNHNLSTGQTRHIDFGLEIENPFVYGITQGPNGLIWATLSSMIASVQIDDIHSEECIVTLYDSEDGLPGSDFSHRSIALLGNGTIAAGGLHGVTYFRPTHFVASHSQPRVMFTGLYVDGQRISPNQKVEGRVVIDKSITLAPTINIPSRDCHFAIHFATDNAEMPQKTKYFYRFGDKNEWIECMHGTNFVSFNRLSPGRYDLYVKSVTYDGKECLEPSFITIIVHPPFWATTFAFIVYGLLLLGILLLIFHLLRKRELKELETRHLRTEAERQEQLNEMKLKFFTNISHELRTPLTLILSPLESLKKENVSPQTSKKIDIMHRNAQHLLDLVNQILDMRKIEMHGLELKPMFADVLSYIRAISSNFNIQASNCNIDYRVTTTPDSYNMNFDQDKLGKIINNLLSNAFKFTPSGGSVWLIAKVDDSNLEIKVIDTGSGIPDESKKHVFERFYQSENANNTGSGIGLNMVWEYVQLHKGTVDVADNPDGSGTVFTVTIPIDKTQAHESIVKGLRLNTDKEKSEAKPTALIVDDNHDIIELLNETLSEEYNVVSASNGKTALMKIMNHHPDIIVTDVMMPVMDGIEFCRHVKSNPHMAQIPLIMLTAKHDISSTLMGLTIGADDYIAKPFNSEELMLRMRKLITLTQNGMKRPLIEPQPSDIEIVSLDEKLIGKAVSYVENNMSNPDLSVELLSEHLCMSRVNLYKKMMQVIGKPPKEFIRSLRLKRASQLLRESQLSVSEIAYAVGFNLPRAFSKYFKEEYGILPSEYKETYGKG